MFLATIVRVGSLGLKFELRLKQHLGSLAGLKL